MKISGAKFYRYELPLTRPFDLRGTPMKKREGLIIAIESDTGARGYGEIAPLPGFSGESLDDAYYAACRCVDAIKMRADISLSRPAALRERESFPPSVRCGLEWALLDMAARMEHISAPALYTSEVAPQVPLNALVAGSHYEALRHAEAAAAAGYRVLKLKVGRDTVERDIETVLALRKRVGESILLRPDANRAWSFDDALQFTRAVAECGISYIEEPLSDATRLAEFAAVSPVPIAVDETLQELGWQAIFHLREAGVLEPFAEVPDNLSPLARAILAARAWVVKPTLTGFSLNYMQQLLTGRRRISADLVISSSFESGYGLCALASIAACAGQNALPAGLDTASWLTKDIIDGPLPLRNGAIDIAEAGALLARFSPEQLEEIGND